MEPVNFSPYLRLIQKTGVTKHPYGFSATDLLLQRAHLTHDSKLLDVGCGAGHTSAHIAKTHNCSVVGIDISHDALDRAQALYQHEPFFGQMSFAQASVQKLPFPDEHFDVVLCESVLFFVNDKETALQEMMRVLKPGGFLALNEITVSDKDDKRRIQDYFLRPEFGGFLVTADVLVDCLNQDEFSLVLKDEKPFDITTHLKSELRGFLSFKSLLPILEIAHQTWSNKDVRDDVMSVVKFALEMPKGTLESLQSLLLMVQKKPPIKTASRVRARA